MTMDHAAVITALITITNMIIQATTTRCGGHHHDDAKHAHSHGSVETVAQSADIGHAHGADEKACGGARPRRATPSPAPFSWPLPMRRSLASRHGAVTPSSSQRWLRCFPLRATPSTPRVSGAIFTIEMLMTIAAIGAIIIGEAEEAAIVVLLFSVGELLEGFAAARARSGIKGSQFPAAKTALVEENGTLRQVAADKVRIGQVVVARPGDRIAADGVVMEGRSSVDRSPMTGESIPVAKEKGARVFAGSINHDGSLRIRVDRAPEDNTIARIITLVEEAQDARAPTERFIQNFSRYYMPLIVAISALTIVVPPLVGLGDWDTGFIAVSPCF